MFTKGQIFSVDFMFALSLFLTGLTIVLFFWSYVNTQISESKTYEEMSSICYSISDIWFNEGYPEFWNPNNVVVLGLSNNKRINQTKLNYLSILGYEKVKRLVGAQLYELYFRVYDENNVTLFSFPSEEPQNERIAFRAKRLGILNSTPVVIETVVWS